jgi:hypothetical protein
MCRQLDAVARGLGLESTKTAILPELVELANDEEATVRIVGLETVVGILTLFDEGQSPGQAKVRQASGQGLVNIRLRSVRQQDMVRLTLGYGQMDIRPSQVDIRPRSGGHLAKLRWASGHGQVHIRS